MKNEDIGRRGFLTAAGRHGGIHYSETAKRCAATQANSAVRVGLLGCGGRGTTHTETILKNTDARVTALADMFQDRLDKAKQLVDKLSAAKGTRGIQTDVSGPATHMRRSWIRRKLTR